MSQSIKDHPIYSNIKTAHETHGKRLSFQLSAHEIMQLLNNQPESVELNALIKTKLAEVESKVDKRGIDKQREIRGKYQGTHGLIFKGIPGGVERQVVYNAILKLGKTGKFDFDGELKMRSFQYPKLKKNQSLRIAFPIFVRQQDRDRILDVVGEKSELILPVENCKEYHFEAADWDGVVTVERVKTRHSGNNSHQEGFTSEAESDFQELRPMGQGDSNSSAGSSNRLFQTPIPYQTLSACLTPNLLNNFPLAQNTSSNIQYQNLSQFPSPQQTNYQIPPQNFDFQQNMQYPQNSQFQQ